MRRTAWCRPKCPLPSLVQRRMSVFTVTPNPYRTRTKNPRFFFLGIKDINKSVWHSVKLHLNQHHTVSNDLYFWSCVCCYSFSFFYLLLSQSWDNLNPDGHRINLNNRESTGCELLRSLLAFSLRGDKQERLCGPATLSGGPPAACFSGLKTQEQMSAFTRSLQPGWENKNNEPGLCDETVGRRGVKRNAEKTKASFNDATLMIWGTKLL